MATPQRQFQPEPEPKLPPSARPQLHPAPTPPRRAPRRWRYGYSWIILAVVLVVWYVGFGWGDSGGWIWGARESAFAPANDGQLSGSGVAILEVADKLDYVGQSFEVRDVPVDHWSAKNAVWIGSSHSYLPMLLILPAGSRVHPVSGGAPASSNPDGGQGSTAPGAAPQQRLNVTGRLVKAPPLAEAQQRWNLSDDDVDQLEEQGVYIQATAAQPARH